MNNSDKALAVARDCANALFASDRASRELGMSLSVPAPGSADVSMIIGPAMVNGHGLCHGGFIFALADSAFAFACNAYNRVTVAAGASIDFVKPAFEGDRLLAQARERRRGRRTGVYDVTVLNQAGELVALFRGRAADTGKAVLNDTQ